MGLTRSEAIDAAACIVAGTCFPDPDPKSELTSGWLQRSPSPVTLRLVFTWCVPAHLRQVARSTSYYSCGVGGGGWAGAVEGVGGRLQTSTSPPFCLPHSKDSCSASFVAALVQDLKGMSVLPPR